MTPFRHNANLLVMGAGGYRSMDYIKVGTPLTFVMPILLVLLIPVFFPYIEFLCYKKPDPGYR